MPTQPTNPTPASNTITTATAELTFPRGNDRQGRDDRGTQQGDAGTARQRTENASHNDRRQGGCADL